MAGRVAKSRLGSESAKARDTQLRKEGWSGTLSERMAISKWGPGLEVTGTIIKTKKLPDRNGKTGGHLFYVDTENGRECYGAPAVLFDVLDTLVLPAEVYILCLGKGEATEGKSAPWLFDVRTRAAD
jgi:hypothetical protein